MMNEACLLRSRVALSRSGIIEDAGIAIQAGIVTAVGHFSDVAANLQPLPVRDLGEVALLPGFVNAHVHLELSHLRGKVPFRGYFAEWLGAVADESMVASPRVFRLAVEEGIAESIRCGTTAVGDVGLWGQTYSSLASSSLAGTLYCEAIGLEPRLARKMFWWARRRVARSKRTERLRPGISPHAAYTTSAELYRACVHLARHWNLPIMTHAAETKEEQEFLTKGTGPLMDLARQHGWLRGKWQPPGKSSGAYLAELGLLGPASLLAHLNYPSPSDIEVAAKSGTSVAFCPRSHRFFNHDPYPLPSLLGAGINVCLGTDSLASNESLSVLEEARLLAKDFPQLSPSTVFAMATSNGAQALGLDGKAGEIAPGAWANLLTLDLTPLGRRVNEQAILELLLGGGAEPTRITV